MVEVVVLSARPEGDNVVKGPWEIYLKKSISSSSSTTGATHTIAAVSINGLEETEDDPQVDGHNVEVLGEVAVEEGSSNGACAENGDLDRVSVFSSQAERCRVLVVELVDIAVKGPIVESLVSCKSRMSLAGA